MKRLLLLITVIGFGNYSASAQLTSFEKSDGKESADYFEAINWYKSLSKKSSEIKIIEMGTTDAGYPLHLILISHDRTFNPAQWHSKKKVVILINNGIHAGEPDGIDANMMLTRDIINNKIILPDNVTVAIIPVYNIGGCLNRNNTSRVNQNGPNEYGFRGNSQNLDLNRDFTKNDSRESKSFAAIFHYLNPDIFIDNHVSDGADYQHTMTLLTTQYDKLEENLGSWLKDIFEPSIYTNMSKKGWDLIPYVDFEFTNLDDGMNMFYDPPRYSSGYAALFNTLSFVPETHMLKPYKQRVKSTYDLMISFIEEAHLHASEIIQKRKEANEKGLIKKQISLKWLPQQTKFKEIIFKGYEKDSSLSEATGLQKYFFNHNKPFTRKIKFYNHFQAVDNVELPTAYIIPYGWQDVIERLKINGVKLEQLKKDSLINVTAYHIESYKSSARPYEKHHKNYEVKTSSSSIYLKFLKGDYIIKMNQSANRYLAEMLEPNGDDSFFAWNFFDGILQQKEGYSDYRWEDIAAEVLKKDSLLREKLENKKKTDSAFAIDASQILDFIYKNSPYYEKVHMRYPVFRIE